MERTPHEDVKPEESEFEFSRHDSPEDEEDDVLTLNSLRVAFANVDAQEKENGFQWDSSPQSGRKTTPFASSSPPLTLYEQQSDEDESEELPGDLTETEQEELESPMLEEADELLVLETEFESETPEEQRVDVNPLSLLESMLFVGNKENRPLSREKASEMMRNVSPEEIDALAEELNRRYTIWNCPYEIVRDKRGFRMTLRDDFEPVRTKFYGRVKEARLTQSAIDVLSLVAYKQPITAEEVQRIRKQPSAPILSQLVRRDLIGIVRETEGKRRITYYVTTDRFLRLFELETLADLPVSEELEEI